MYTITLNDGTKLERLELNGNNYIAEGIIPDSVFEGKLSSVSINNGEETETLTDMVLVSNRVEDGHSWFILAEKTAQDKARERLENLLVTTTDDITDIQSALADIYEMIVGGI